MATRQFKKFDTCLAVSIEFRRVREGQKGGRIVRYLATAQSALCIASRGKIKNKDET